MLNFQACVTCYTSNFFSTVNIVTPPKYRVRSYPDPTREEETSWMTKGEIDAEYMRRSTNWIESGSGSLGRIFVEFLACDNIPNQDLDIGSLTGNLSDPFACAVFEDTYVVTDVIDDCLSPRWMPWSRRAFVFNILHPSSPLHIGVFDFDSMSLEHHDTIGRITVDISNLPVDTDCVLRYNLYPSARVTKRRQCGTITLRMRLQYNDFREAILASIEMPPEFYINCKTKRDYAQLRFTCDGKYDRHHFSMKMITSLIDELTSYQVFCVYIKDCLMNHLLWRSEETIFVPTLKGGKHGAVSFSVPIASIITFLAGIVLVERPELIPSSFFAFLAWMMLEALAYRRSNPSPWRRPRSFVELLTILILGKGMPPRIIEKHENQRETEAFVNFWQKRMKSAEDKIQRKTDEYCSKKQRAKQEYEEETVQPSEITTDEIIREDAGFTVDPLKPILFPLQIYLAMVVDSIRVTRNIVMWEETYYAFWLTAGFILLSVSCLFIPWGFMLKWSARILVWSILGPWMKLIDLYYLKPLETLSVEERTLREEHHQRALAKKFDEARKKTRVQRENIEKLFDMKKYLFGRIIMKVPAVRHDRHIDSPLNDSYGVPYFAEDDAKGTPGKWTVIHSQRLIGDMIPTVSYHAAT